MIGEKTLEALEFPKIRLLLLAHCDTPMGRELAESLVPSTDPVIVRQWLEETAEAEQVLRCYGAPSFAGVYDLRPLLERARVGGILRGEELGQVSSTLTAIRGVRRFTDRLAEALPHWRAVARQLNPLPDLEAALAASIGSDGGVLDGASPRLAQIRRESRLAEARLKEKLESFLRQPAWQKMLQDLVITQRDRRYVLPVKQEYRHQFPGLVHGQSGSGATLFIEPMAVVELNNQLRLLADQEEEEVNLILARLSAMVGAAHAALRPAVEALGRLDFMLAKARLAREQEATAPELNSDGRIRLKAARHPLLPREKVVPIDLSLGEAYDLLVITGPNTGGKTVSLKTVGLLTAMVQAGLYWPAAAGSTGAVFAGLYADIGDEQSIEQSLSTFSGHLRNIVTILRNLELPSLVLLDEIGAGTDPAEGAALAQAILEYLRAGGARVIVTTHLGDLKVYAQQTPRVANAAVEFDSARLVPTYRLCLGQPGRSNALEIAAALGVPLAIINRARELLGKEQRELGEVIAALEEERREYQRLHAEAARRAKELERHLKELEKARQEFAHKQKETLGQARAEAKALIRQAQAEIRTILRELRDTLDDEGKKAADRARQKAQESLRALDARLPSPAALLEAGSSPLSPEDVTPGRWVWIPRLKQEGQVVAKTAGGEVVVLVGALRLQLPLAELEAVPGPAKAGDRSRPAGIVSVVSESEVASSLTVRGLTTEEALHEVDKYLDAAILAGLSTVTVIHGKGEGILRTAIHRYLDRHPYVKSYRLGGQGEGGSGVTVVNLA
ncbi:MAG: endonuclease MutS2 [Clostridia bacterium]|nr:endonuclease MutS2 [Clostridia bacterium]